MDLQNLISEGVNREARSIVVLEVIWMLEKLNDMRSTFLIYESELETRNNIK